MHILNKRKLLWLNLRQLYLFMDGHSQLTVQNKLLMYKTILKSVFTYGVQLWEIGSNSNTKQGQKTPIVKKAVIKSAYIDYNSVIVSDIGTFNILSNGLFDKLMDTQDEVRRLMRIKHSDLTIFAAAG